MTDPVPTSTVTMLFCDVTASTARLTRLGDDEGDAFRHELFARLDRCVLEAGGKVVKHLGDGLMVVFERSTVSAVLCAREMHRCVDDLDEADPVHLRIGLGVGEVVEEDDDWFGMPVVVAARLCDASQPGQTLAPHHLVALIGSRGSAFSFVSVGEMLLKGFDSPLDVVAVCDHFDQPSDLPTETQEPPSGGGGRTPVTARRVGVMVALAIVGVLVGFGVRSSVGSEQKPSTEVESSRESRSSLSEPEGYTPVLEPAVCGSDSATQSGVICSNLVVPMSRSRPDGPTLKLPVAKLTGPEGSKVDPVIIIDFNDPINRTSLSAVTTVYSLSVRGFSGEIGAKLQCPEMKSAWKEALSKPPSDPETISSKVGAAQSCADELRRNGLPLDSFNLKEVALDLRDLVAALKLNRASIASGGYFTPSAISFANSNPGAVTSLMLSNPTPPGESVLAQPAQTLSSALDLLNDRCEKDTQCSRTFGDLKASFVGRSKLLALEPAKVMTLALDGSGSFDVLLDDYRLASSLKASLAVSERIGLVPQGVLGASDELVAAAGIAEELNTYVSAGSFGPGYLSMVCSYDALSTRLSEIDSNALQAFRGASDPALPKICSVWDVPSVFNEMSAPLRVKVPSLLIEGGFSVSGVNKWALSMGSELSDAQVVSFPSLSEDIAFAPPACLRQLKNEFVKRPNVRLKVSECEGASRPIDFAGPG